MSRKRSEQGRKQEWTSELEGYSKNYISRNYWRVQSTMSFDQAMGEARFVFATLREKYPGVEPKHFMALFKVSLTNHFNDESTFDTNARSIESLEHLEERDESRPYASKLIPQRVEHNEGFLLCLIEEAPEEIQDRMEREKGKPPQNKHGPLRVSRQRPKQTRSRRSDQEILPWTLKSIHHISSTFRVFLIRLSFASTMQS